ncbi:unnamed protein product [Tilletia laevis]|nr:unnamed protein product [Tilletia caries]CAD6895869.1 unnamed protein product [Tilletia controversa]CAD6897200.1 unnamed protein product [Tilletia laevis]CAD6900885.1 unnamed protein product [Tilletia laevis]CAD6911724.1 unnamed protein product [Tilletia controversa]
MNDAKVLAKVAAELCHGQYESLPPRGAKPNRRTDGRREWTVLSGLLLQIQDPSQEDNELHLIALATGVKCSPLDNISPHGDLLHDCHAEILTRRAARKWLLRRLRDEVVLLQSDDASTVLHGIPRIFEAASAEGVRWRLRQTVRVLWYISTLPCGDASTSHLRISRTSRHGFERAGEAPSDGPQAGEAILALSSRISEDAVPGGHAAAGSEVVRGRTNEATLSILRTKPGRADSIPAISLSCSDKLASYVALGVQGSLLSALLEPIVPSVFVIGFVPKEHVPLNAEEQGETLQRDCQRALWDRLEMFLANNPIFDSSRPRQRPTIILLPNPGFCHSKETVELAIRAEQRPEQAWDDVEPVPAAGSVIWTRTETAKGNVENVVAGLKMGASPAKKKGQELLPLHSSRR